jgi:hypothetical protein
MGTLTPDQAPFDENKNGKLDPTELPLYTAKKIADAMTLGGGSNNPKSGTSVDTSKTKLTKESALSLMQDAADAADYMGKFSSADIAQFMKEFDAEQARQVAKVVTSTAQKTTVGATAGAVDKTASNTAKTEYPSFFKPTEFASDWVWSKINFKDEATLGTKSVTALSQVRNIIDQFQLLGVSDAEAKIAAKQIAMGKKTIAEYTTELQQVAIREYPQFADRFKLDPTLTTYDIASPVINMVAKTLEMDPKAVKMDHPIVLAYTRSAGADGKGTPPSYYDLLLKTKQLPEYQKTQQANNEARDSASSLAKALGYGL